VELFTLNILINLAPGPIFIRLILGQILARIIILTLPFSQNRKKGI
jgi:hypothetical protein